MRLPLLIILLVAFHGVKAQDVPVTVTTENSNDGQVTFYANNFALAPYTVHVDISGTNIEIDDKSPMTIIVPPQTSDFEFTRLYFVPNKKATFGYEYSYNIGDAINAKHDKRAVYTLPFPPGKSYYIGQGYNGRFSHVGKLAIDFDMPEGAEVCAARDGLVVETKEDSNSGCRSSKCKDQANYIRVLHDDGSFADYFHLEKNGCYVEPGDMVSAGQTIGASGSTGWASGPHLHFEVYVPGPKKVETVATAFNTTFGKIEQLLEGREYTRPTGQ